MPVFPDTDFMWKVQFAIPNIYTYNKPEENAFISVRSPVSYRKPYIYIPNMYLSIWEECSLIIIAIHIHNRPELNLQNTCLHNINAKWMTIYAAYMYMYIMQICYTYKHIYLLNYLSENVLHFHVYLYSRHIYRPNYIFM